jgi:hypothetical protein
MATRRGKKKVDEAYEFKVYPPGTLSLRDVDLSIRVKGDERYEEELKRRQREVFRLQVPCFRPGSARSSCSRAGMRRGRAGASGGSPPSSIRAATRSGPSGLRTRRAAVTSTCGASGTGFQAAGSSRCSTGAGTAGSSWSAWSDSPPRRSGRRAYDEINAFERMLTSDGVRMTKFFLHIDRKTQLERFRERETDPFKSYKIGPDDWRNRRRWKDYVQAIEEMLDRTHRPDAPWVLVSADDKHHARLEVLRICAEVMASTLEGRR